MRASHANRSGAAHVAAGILASRIAGFVRDRAVAYFFGVGPHADVFRAALRGPNILQNLLGEGTISASFIPIYSRLLAEGRREDAGRFAGAVFGLLLATAALLALLGVLVARPIVAIFATGFLGDAAAIAAGHATVDRFELTVTAVRVVFPMTGVLVLSAWALGVLNSHRRFFLPYLAPVLWNAAIIAALVWAGATAVGPLERVDGRSRILLAACVGALVGGVLQFTVQLPLVARLLTGFRLSFSLRVEGVRQALGALLPVVAGRGVVQLSAYLDLLLASVLAPGAVAALGWAQTLYILPVSLFGLSVAAAELPELSRESTEPSTAAVAQRVNRSLGQMAFVNVAASLAYLAFGFLLIGALYRTGRFSVSDNWLVYLVLAGYSLGLLAATSSRLLQSAFYGLGDTRTPSRIAVQRVVASTMVGVPLMLLLDRFGLDSLGVAAAGGPRLGALGLALGSATGAWIELSFLRRALCRRVPGLESLRRSWVRVGLLAATSALPAAALWWVLPPLHVALTALLVVGTYGAAYLGAALLLDLPEAEAWTGRLRRRLGR